MSTIALLATLDTKWVEAGFLRETLQTLGDAVLLIDIGMMGSPPTRPDISGEEVLANGGHHFDVPLASLPKETVMDAMTEGAATLQKLQKAGAIDGVLALGGAQGSAVCCQAMMGLPIGFPKVVVSTIACGKTQFGPYVGTRDIVLIPSIADVCGVNAVTKAIFTSAAGAVSGMARAAQKAPALGRRPVVALTMAGITTPCVMRAKALLDEKGFETIVFHCNGIGATVINEMARDGELAGVIDATPHDFTDYMFGGEQACEEGRFRDVYKSGVPTLTLPGGTDIVVFTPGSMPAAFKGHQTFRHTPQHIHTRVTRAENVRQATALARLINTATAHQAVMIPLRGFSRQNAPGGPLYDEAANSGFVQGMQDNLRGDIPLLKVDSHINDEGFAKEMVDAFLALLG